MSARSVALACLGSLSAAGIALGAGCASVTRAKPGASTGEHAAASPSLEARLREGRERGAARCAPLELALAEAHARFAALRRGQGDHWQARDHEGIADALAREAARFSRPDRCAL